MTKKFLVYGFTAAFLSSCFIGYQDDELADETEEPNAETFVQDDAGTGNDVQSGFESPFAISNGEINGVLSSDDDGDAYGAKMNPGDIITLRVVPSKDLNVSFSMYFYATEEYVKSVDDGLVGISESVTIATDASDSEKSFAILVRAVGGAGTYVLALNTDSQNDGDVGVDAPEGNDEPLPISAGSFSGGYLGNSDSFDHYAIKLNSGASVTVTAYPSSTLDIGLEKGNCYYANDCDVYSNAEINDDFKGMVESFTFVNEFAEQMIFKFGVGALGNTKGTYKLTVTIN